MLLRAIRPFARHPRVAQIVVALPSSHVASPPEWLREVTGARLQLTAGGDTRADSVAAALEVLDPACTMVLVHDAARPFVSLETIDAVIEHVGDDTAIVPGVAVTDTLKRVAGPDLRIIKTVDRSVLWRAHTPQGFPRHALDRAFAATRGKRAGFTDEAGLVEATGFPVRMIPDRGENLKITTAGDLEVAEFLAQR
jgi:2-C-methyl-D-erythritol 4-phosphate cytidylyltransferase